MASNKNLLVAAFVTATAAVGALTIYILTRPPPKHVKTEPSVKPQPFAKQLDKEELCKVLQDLTTGIQQVIMSLAQEEQSLMSNPEAHKMSPEHVQKFLLQRFQEGAAQTESQVFHQHGIGEVQLKEATTKYEDDAEVKKAVQQLKSVYGAVMGGNPADLPTVPDFLTKEKTLEVLIETMKILRVEAQATVKTLEGKGIDRTKDTAQFQQEFQKLYGAQVEVARKELYKANNIDDDLLIQAAVVKYQSDQEFQRKLKKSSEEHTAEMAKLGFFSPGGGAPQ